MAGIYLHIPFCRKLCYYCDFHFVATLKYKEPMLKALKREIELRSHEWKDELFQTVYFGGGTPSVLSVEELKSLFVAIEENFQVADDAEITLEANPDDLNGEYLAQLANETPVNRLSIGIQSFSDSDLQLMNRRHTAAEAVQAVINAQQAGFYNLNIDLIYAVPGLSLEQWENNINTFLELKIPHLSAYHLGIEPKTVFDYLRRKNKISAIDEAVSQQHYQLLTNLMRKNHYQHYEISNFALEGYYSKHNNGYWKGHKYIGIGPSAHSYNGFRRSWNVSNNTLFCQSLLEEIGNHVSGETIDETMAYNEYMLTSLRTSQGASFTDIGRLFGTEKLTHTRNILQALAPGGNLILTDSGFSIKEHAWLVSDSLISEFFIT